MLNHKLYAHEGKKTFPYVCLHTTEFKLLYYMQQPNGAVQAYTDNLREPPAGSLTGEDACQSSIETRPHYVWAV